MVQTADAAGDEGRGEGQRVRKVKRIPIKIIGVKDESALVDLDGDRRYLPASAVKDFTVSSTAWKKGIPHGVPWDTLAEGLSSAMHKSGIWTRENLSKNQRPAWAIAQAFNLDLAELNQFATKEA